MTGTPTTTPVTDALSGGTAPPPMGDAPRGVHRLAPVARVLGLTRWAVSIPVAVYLLLVLAGVTQSSIGIEWLRQDPANLQGFMINEALTIRSDEFLTSTPLSLGVMASGTTESLNPLTAPHGFVTMLPDGPISTVVLLDGAVLRLGPLLPDQMLLAAKWWFPFLLLVLAAPAYFRSLTGSRWIGYFAAAVVIFSPASAWWSFAPLGMIAFTLAGAAALLRCAEHLGRDQRWWAAGWGLLGAVLLARTPLHYQPWAIVIAPAILLPAVAALLADGRRRRTSLVALAGTGLTSVVLLAGLLLENRESISASLGTVYPGSRVASGGANPLQEIFGATNLLDLDALAVTGTNTSEISSSFAVAALWAVLVLASGIRFRDARHRAATGTVAVLTAFWFAWSLVDFGGLGARIPVLNLVPPQRSSDVLGFISVLLLCLVLPGLTDRPRRGLALLAGSGAALVSAHAGSLLRSQNLLDLSVASVWLAAAVVGAVVVAITWRPRAWGGYAVAVVLAFLTVVQVNPVLVGVGDLRSSDVAGQMLDAGDDSRREGGVWATDNIYVDTLLIATGVPSLSGRQLAGPDREAWERLDPGSANEEVWNRGGSYIWFAWTAEEQLTFTNPGADIIAVSGSPCTVAARMPELDHIVASQELDLPCLAEVDTFTWGQGDRWVYAVSGGPTEG